MRQMTCENVVVVVVAQNDKDVASLTSCIRVHRESGTRTCLTADWGQSEGLLSSYFEQTH
jgi:hypothetical protein